MRLRFAATGKGQCAVVAWRLTALRHRAPANDNAPAVHRYDSGRGALLRAALRHFALHGADAAEHARANAEHAFFADRRGEYLHWLAICRALDRRLVTAEPGRR